MKDQQEIPDSRPFWELDHLPHYTSSFTSASGTNSLPRQVEILNLTFEQITQSFGSKTLNIQKSK